MVLKCVFLSLINTYYLYYNRNNTYIFLSFLDASEAFDNINHILIQRLKYNNIPL